MLGLSWTQRKWADLQDEARPLSATRGNPLHQAPSPARRAPLSHAVLALCLSASLRIHQITISSEADAWVLSHRSSVVAVVNVEERYPWDGAAVMLPRRDGAAGDASCSAEPFQGGAKNTGRRCVPFCARLRACNAADGCGAG